MMEIRPRYEHGSKVHARLVLVNSFMGQWSNSLNYRKQLVELAVNQWSSIKNVL
jgi:hypothetical protein